MNHYVYKLTDPKTKQFYIGSRSCKCNPIEDDYMGSMKTWKPIDKHRFRKEIIKSDFETRGKAIEYEANLIEDNINDPLNENYHIPPYTWHTTGRIPTEGELEILSNRTKNTVVVRDGDGNCFRVSVDDDRYKSGELVHVNVGIERSDEFKEKLSKSKQNSILAKDDDGNPHIIKLDDDRYKSGELVAYSSGTCVVENTNGDKFRVNVDDDRLETGELKKQTVPDWGIKKSQKVRMVRVQKFDLDGEFIKEYECITDAAKDVGGLVTAISGCINGNSKTSYGYKWKRVNKIDK